jgi:hypothetical protein
MNTYEKVLTEIMKMTRELTYKAVECNPVMVTKVKLSVNSTTVP